MRCVVVTPEETILNVESDFVAIPLYDGEIGIGGHHTPLVGRLGCGELRIKDKENLSSYYVENGFVEVLNNTVTLLTNRAVPISELDIDKSTALLNSALKKFTKNEEQLDLKEQNIFAARSQVRLARKAKGE
ncbi:MAG: ATP synthase F1 subunit epsilon [Planctomycetaceae bacterium]|jgi:F-type H+-transporting ATPase subunit epsilon|nr:ATP synthase F1 subunit epsilon [Planctomycetaceae bacterium]